MVKVDEIKEKIDDVFLHSMKIDGAEHLVAGIVIADASTYLMPMWCVVLFTMLILCAKEVVYDWYMGKGTPEWRDLFWGVVGMALGIL